MWCIKALGPFFYMSIAVKNKSVTFPKIATFLRVHFKISINWNGEWKKRYTTMFQSLSLQTWGTGVIGTFSYRTVAVRYWKYCPWHMLVRIRSFHNKLFILHLWSWHLILISILCSFNLPARILTVIYKKAVFLRKKAVSLRKETAFLRKKTAFLYITVKILAGRLKLQRIDINIKCHDHKCKINSLLWKDLILTSMCHGQYFQYLTATVL